jgi:hypothetical protein
MWCDSYAWFETRPAGNLLRLEILFVGLEKGFYVGQQAGGVVL